MYSRIVYIIFLIFFSYFVLLTCYYLLMVLLGFWEGAKRKFESEEEDYPSVYLSTFTIPVTVIIPAHNEEVWIRDSVLSILNLNYPKFELIIVDDGSTDRTLSILKEELRLSPVDVPYIKHYKDGVVEEILKSEKYPDVTVIHKSSGFKKAGALNAGLNMAKYDYVCMMDADTILDQNALLKVMAYVMKEPASLAGIGSYFSLSNGLKIKNGRVIEKHFSYNPIIAFQHIEYIRSFIGNRIAWSRFNAMPIVAGGFAVWRRDLLYELGGFSADFTCEDIEFTFRAHEYLAKNKRSSEKIVMLPYHVGWTEGPGDIKSLISQRERWQRVTNETIWRYKNMLFNPAFRGFGFLVMPYFVFYEGLGVFIESASIAFVAIGWIMGVLDMKAFIAFLALMIIWQSMISLLSIFSFIRTQKLYPLKYIIYLALISFPEFFLYRWILSYSKLLGTYKFFRRVKTHDSIIRVKA